MENSNLTLTIYLMRKEREKKSHLLTDYKRSYFPNYSPVLSANMY